MNNNVLPLSQREMNKVKELKDIEYELQIAKKELVILKEKYEQAKSNVTVKENEIARYESTLKIGYDALSKMLTENK